MGFAVGVIGYLLGLGGGALIVPVLVLVFGYPIHEAIASSLVAIIAGSIMVASVNLRKEIINIRYAVTLELVTVFGAIIGSFISVSIPEKPLSLVFAFVMVVTAVFMWKKSQPSEALEQEEGSGALDSFYYDESRGVHVNYCVKRIAPTLGVSGAAGLISGMLGVGGGIFKVPAMNIVSCIPIRVATATSNFMIGFTAAAGCIAYFRAGYVNPLVAGSMVVGVLFGSRYATRKLTKVTDKKVKLIFILFLLFVALQMFIKGLQ